ncbi:hypothetical protein Scep_025718 [Stephania cephalantha]|uniref:Uncharacterized protein n=1 Tax=Stephania cephalantha TaxID=152367 RepID=A0AAP0EJ79_9MAGN
MEEKEQGDESWVKVVRKGKKDQATRDLNTHHHSQELPISFHSENKFFKVMRLRNGGSGATESTSKAEFTVFFTNKKTFWLAKLCSREGGGER